MTTINTNKGPVEAVVRATLGVNPGHSNQPCFEMYPTHPWVAEVIRGIIGNQMMNSDDYRMKAKCNPFLQGCEDTRPDTWVLVEFWQPDGHQEFIDYVNGKIRARMILEDPNVKDLADKLCSAISGVAHDMVEPDKEESMDEVLGLLGDAVKEVTNYISGNV